MHRRLVVVLLIVIIATTVIDATKKVEDWDELESLLENIDEIGETKKATAATIDGEDADVMVPTKEMAMADGVDDDDDDPLERDRITKSGEVKTNPCEDYVCGWGKECIVDKKHAEPTCECIRDCPESTTTDRDPNDQVCSSSNETFPSLCHLYRQRCLCKRQSKHCQNVELAKAHLEYLGACKQLDECTDELMEQFPGRMADWLFQVMRELKKRRELHNLEWEELINEAETDDEKKHVYPVIWKFCDLDIKPQDKHVSHHELIPITAPVIPMESCIKPFLEKCDSDSNGSITIHEWGRCLGLKEGEIQERC